MLGRSARALGALVLLATSLEGAPAQAQPIDLLRATRVDLAVSSPYRDRLTQAAALVDGDLETAWNSRTGDLVGAWIEVRLPANAQVSGIAMTVGFTRRNGESDLFTGNHRITRARILRDGQLIGEHALNPDSRELQTIPVTGPGGTYRIEIAAVTPGTQRRWREVCISELRILGTAPGAQAGQRFPRLALRTLPAPRVEPGTTDRGQVRTRLLEQTRRFGTEWRELNDTEGTRRRACMLDETDRQEAANLRARRARFLTQLAELVEAVDEVRADRLRAAAYARERSLDDAEIFEPNDQTLVSSGLQAVVDWLGEDEARCRWASTDAALRLRRASHELGVLTHDCEHNDMNYPDGVPRDVERECRVVERLSTRLDELDAAAARSLRSTAPQLDRFEIPQLSSPAAQTEWTAMRAALAIARQSCGW